MFSFKVFVHDFSLNYVRLKLSIFCKTSQTLFIDLMLFEKETCYLMWTVMYVSSEGGYKLANGDLHLARGG